MKKNEIAERVDCLLLSSLFLHLVPLQIRVQSYKVETCIIVLNVATKYYHR